MDISQSKIEEVPSEDDNSRSSPSEKKESASHGETKEPMKADNEEEEESKPHEQSLDESSSSEEDEDRLMYESDYAHIEKILKWKVKYTDMEDEETAHDSLQSFQIPAIYEMEQKGLNLVVLLPPYLPRSKRSHSEAPESLTAKLDGELLQYFPMLVADIESMRFKS